MEYKFYCDKCKKDVLVDIPLSEYDKEKSNQKCAKCGQPIRRVLEWNGIASGSGEGWFGKSNGGNTI